MAWVLQLAHHSAVGLSEGEVVGLTVGVAWVIMEDSILH